MNEPLQEMLKYLRLNGLLAHWDDYLVMSRQQNLSHVRWLEKILEEEVHLKRERARQMRLKMAKIPEVLLVETYPFDQQPNLDKNKVLSLYDSFEFMTQAENILWVGRSGCGKTGLATGFLVQAINRGYTGRFVTFQELLSDLLASGADHSEAKILKKYVNYDILLVDELGYVEVDPVQVGLFFTLMQRRHRKKVTLITSNLGFIEWRSFLKNDQLTIALIDRLTETSHVINIKNGRSLRKKLDG